LGRFETTLKPAAVLSRT